MLQFINFPHYCVRKTNEVKRLDFWDRLQILAVHSVQPSDFAGWNLITSEAADPSDCLAFWQYLDRDRIHKKDSTGRYDDRTGSDHLLIQNFQALSRRVLRWGEQWTWKARCGSRWRGCQDFRSDSQVLALRMALCGWQKFLGFRQDS